MMLVEPLMFLNTGVITRTGLLRIEPPPTQWHVWRSGSICSQYCWEWEWEYYRQAGTGGLLVESTGLECSHARKPTYLLYRQQSIVLFRFLFLLTHVLIVSHFG